LAWRRHYKQIAGGGLGEIRLAAAVTDGDGGDGLIKRRDDHPALPTTVYPATATLG
jgi:hypothetical protein